MWPHELAPVVICLPLSTSLHLCCRSQAYSSPFDSLTLSSREIPGVQEVFALVASTQEDFPALDLCDAQQPQRRPGIVRKSGLDCLLAFGIDDEQNLLTAAKRAAEDDEAVVYECV